MRFLFLFPLLFVLASCAMQAEHGAEHMKLTPVAFCDLDGWHEDAPAAALLAFRNSCLALSAKPGTRGKIAAWKLACSMARTTPATDEAARAYFEMWFRPYAVAGNAGEYGLFTGYYTPELRGSLRREGAYQTPLYAKPTDKDDKNASYGNRAAIVAGSLDARAKPLAWVDDPVDAFFLEVQGSGRVRLSDGRIMPVGYDGNNGWGYVAIGRVLADRGAIPRPVTMPAIRAWLKANPAQAQDVMNENPSYVFFRKLPNDDVVGAEGVALTPLRSLAVDKSFLPLGTPVWLDTTDGQGATLRRLMIAQDTGGAIKGVVRGDFFWGEGALAETQAGLMQSRGRAYVLLPKNVSIDDE